MSYWCPRNLDMCGPMSFPAFRLLQLHHQRVDGSQQPCAILLEEIRSLPCCSESFFLPSQCKEELYLQRVLNEATLQRSCIACG